ncbi:hypothetical protein [Streptomyces sp. NPDC006147]|uniref:hypothetical protein n=1 Tax=unclassified Streptomyces TaxID=2593676 RepID=UPI0033B2E467
MSAAHDPAVQAGAHGGGHEGKEAAEALPLQTSHSAGSLGRDQPTTSRCRTTTATAGGFPTVPAPGAWSRRAPRPA